MCLAFGESRAGLVEEGWARDAGTGAREIPAGAAAAHLQGARGGCTELLNLSELAWMYSRKVAYPSWGLTSAVYGHQIVTQTSEQIFQAVSHY